MLSRDCKPSDRYRVLSRDCKPSDRYRCCHVTVNRVTGTGCCHVTKPSDKYRVLSRDYVLIEYCCGVKTSGLNKEKDGGDRMILCWMCKESGCNWLRIVSIARLSLGR